jgi:nicotinamide-nucleotide amidase
MTAEIISIGDEILIGQIVNTNAAYIGEKLLAIGVRVGRVTTIGDQEEIILDSLRKAFQENEIIIITGGLGPTHDDITKKVIAKFFNCGFRKDAEVYEHVKNLLTKRGVPMSFVNDDQASVPEICKVLFNKAGTAPGMYFEQNGKEMFVMPGVPFEMKYIMDNHILPYLQSKTKGFIKVRTLMACGIGESALFTLIGDVDDLTRNAELAFLPSPRGVKLRIMTKSMVEKEAADELMRVYLIIKEKAGEYIYSDDEKELEEILGQELTSKKLTLAVAESCTGGKLADRLTDVSGSSKYFMRGVVTYSNQSKTDLLDVPAELINSKGAVSAEVAKLMAENVRKKTGTDIGLSTTGIAGPTGGTPEKPVGLVWIGYSDKFETFAKEFNLGDIRKIFKERASQMALNILRNQLKKHYSI